MTDPFTGGGRAPECRSVAAWPRSIVFDTPANIGCRFDRVNGRTGRKHGRFAQSAAVWWRRNRYCYPAGPGIHARIAGCQLFAFPAFRLSRFPSMSPLLSLMSPLLSPTAPPLSRRLIAMLAIVLTTVAVLAPSTLAAEEAVEGVAGDQEGEIDFAHQIVPLLQNHCVACHGGLDAKSSFSINTRELIVGSGYVDVGDSAASYLFELVTSDDPDQRMPPADQPQLTAAEIELLRRWIDGGLEWTDGFTFAPNSYEPPLLPRRPVIPAEAPSGWQQPLDRLMVAYLQQHQLPLPESIDDATFIRRVSLDLTGLLPSPERLQQFLVDSQPGKRERLIDELLADEIAYTEHWLTFFNDLLRNDYSGTGFITGGRSQISDWLYQALRTNMPFDQLARELIAPPTAASRGFIDGIKWRGEVSAGQSVEIQFAQSVAQSFLGLNLKCASCHDSFVDRWTLDEAFGLAAIYAERPLELHRCDQPTGRIAQAGWLFPEIGQVDSDLPRDQRLAQLADLMTADENGRFARTIVNRLWYKLMGRGIVHPLDAMQAQPWDEDLLDYLAVELADQDYDLKALLRLIARSRIYQSATAIQTAEPSGDFIFRQPLPRRMTAEQFLDAVWQLCDAAPTNYDAPVVRGPTDLESAGETAADFTAHWIWGQSADRGDPPAGETILLRRTVHLPAEVISGGAIVTVDNSFELFINGQRVAGGDNWNHLQTVSLAGRLRAGDNDLAVVATNAGQSPNPAGLFLIAKLQLSDGSALTLVTDDQWQASAPIPTPPADELPAVAGPFQPAVQVAAAQAWTDTIDGQISSSLARAAYSSQRPVRASLMKNDFLMKSLGRPLREQIVSMRPDELTTLEAIDLYNGQTLADVLEQGGRVWNQRTWDAPEQLVQQIYLAAYSRPPSRQELTAAAEFLTDTPTADAVADLLWAVIMNPEFILTR